MNRLLFSKTGDGVYLSHLDTMRIFQRAFRRADILIWHSQGFSPRAYVSIALPLSVGVESQCEILDFEIEDGSVDMDKLPELLNKTMPAGIRVLQAYESTKKSKFLTEMESSITLEYDSGIPNGAEEALRELFSRDSIVVLKHGKKGEQETDIRPKILDVQLQRKSDTELQLMLLAEAQNPGLNPMLLVQAIEKELPRYKPDFSHICRLEVYDEAHHPFR